MSENLPYPAPTRRLPQQPNLEQLRKQAKDLLEQYRSGEPAAIGEVERFERTPDRSTFALHDAQRILARAYGYESWSKLKAFVDGVNVASFAEAVKGGNLARVRKMLASRPELIGMDMAENDEHRALHYAVLRRNVPMVRLLMEAGADARKGIYPHRDATSALALAMDREYHDVIAVIEEEERFRREEMSCPNAAVSPVQDQISAAIACGDNATAMRLLDADRSLIRACDRDGATPLHVAAQATNVELVAWLLERGPAVGKQDLNGLTALDRAALAADPRNQSAQRFPAVARLLLAHGADLTIRAAVALADEARVRELIGSAPHVLRQVTANGGLLTLAVNHGHLEMIRSMAALLGRGIDTNVSRFGQTALHFAAAYHGRVTDEDRARFACLLLDHGARLDVRDDLLKSTPLGWACRWGRQKLAELLIQRGAPVHEADAEPWATPRAWAAKMKHTGVLNILE